MMFENEKCSFELALSATDLDCSLRLTSNWKSKAGAKVSYDYVLIGVTADTDSGTSSYPFIEKTRFVYFFLGDFTLLSF